MFQFVHDLRVSLRQLWRTPAFTVAAILTLAVGVGANTAVFTVVQNVLLSALPYRNSERIVAVETAVANRPQTPRVTGGDVVDLRQQTSAFERFSVYFGGEMGFQLRDHAIFTRVMLVNADFPYVFGVQPRAGRLFEDSEAAQSALVRESFAKSNFGSAAAALGQTVNFEQRAYTITAVLPDTFDFPRATQVWIGTSSTPENLNRTAYNYRAVALLKQGTTVSSAQKQVSVLATRLAEAYPDSNKNKNFAVVPLREQLVGKSRPMLVLLMGAAALILLIACANLMNLQFARATTRYREVAVRTALGASRLHVVRLIVVEALLLGVLGAALSALLALPLLRAVLAVAPAGIPRLDEVHLNFPVFAFNFVITLFATVVSGLASAGQLWQIDLNSALRQDAVRGAINTGTSRIRSLLIVSEIALTLVLAVGAGLLVRTLQSLNSTDLGFNAQSILVAYAHAPADTEEQYAARPVEFANIFRELSALSGVQSVAGVMGLPAGQYGSNGRYELFGSNPDDGRQSNFTLSSPGYFSTMRIPLLRGRDFADADKLSSEPVAIISNSLAHSAFGDADPIGRKIRCGLDRPEWMTIVGVVGDVRQDSPASRPGPTLYMPLTQHPYHANELQIVMRTHVVPASLIETVRKKIQAADPTIATKFTTMDEMIDDAVSVHRFRTYLLGAFASLGFVLAALGVYGIMAYTVAQRRYEVGVRMALGASRLNILSMVLSQALRLAIVGIATGVVASLAAARLMSSMVYGVAVWDPPTIVACCGLILLTAIGAALLPAKRAAAVDPLVAIRYE